MAADRNRFLDGISHQQQWPSKGPEKKTPRSDGWSERGVRVGGPTPGVGSGVEALIPAILGASREAGWGCL